ncbi:probable pancreatic secretory proteinase inhibitor isoform X3 [Erpetoichthys calabaricus]|uniref:probable pancreatic secretory proteinase inhibitor isoform X2 n=1 Tax=Erpetoichthys calabaricus TaxID=27687 RepID=UPI0022345E1F|nr:probable pancreatic secretory proteinase inhibitor isoform X2 [Erpetoichthys calabaricus]XP_051779485.1 probable pancreatic secretory proteinase inhibitor isoform X3 [Erpetoichthys calabaricus]
MAGSTFTLLVVLSLATLLLAQPNSAPFPSNHFCGIYNTPADCPDEPSLVCGDDGNTYKNECQLCFEYLSRKTMPAIAKYEGC